MSIKKSLCLAAILLAATFTFAQRETRYEDPSVPSTGGVENNRAVGDVLSSFSVAIPGGGTPVGAQSDGSGNLIITDITNTSVNSVDTAGAFLGELFTTAGANPISAATDGTNYYVTDTVGQQVLIFTNAGAPAGSFSVAGQTTFPEGITYNPNTGSLFVVDGSGGNNVYEYTTGGSLLNTFPVLGSSQDGIAWDQNSQGFWLYDSGTDTLRCYDTSFNQTQAFSGPGAAGFGTGEGVAVIGNRVYVVATGTDTVVVFEGRISVPTLGEWALIGFAALLMVSGLFYMRKRRIA
jgi:DNA-binding beta-propeller fold protein YncE